jgi:uncharacterized protein with PIN domain
MYTDEIINHVDFPKLAVDEMLGKLSIWLRVLGLDALYMTPGCKKEMKIKLAKDRVFITAGSKLSIGRTIRITAGTAILQLVETIKELGLKDNTFHPFIRCLRCNTLLRDISIERVRNQIPAYVAATEKNFKTCQNCGKIFWAGSHRKRMLSELRKTGVTISLTPETVEGISSTSLAPGSKIK